LFAKPNACVVALCDDVRQSMIYDRLNQNVGIIEQELPKRWYENCLGRVGRSCNADRPGRLLAQLDETIDFSSASISSNRGPKD